MPWQCLTRVRLFLAALALAWLAPADLARAAQIEPEGLRSVLLEVSLNGTPLDVTPLRKDAEGRIYAPAAVLNEWRLRLPASPPLMLDGEAHYLLSDLPGLSSSEASETQSLRIEAEASAFVTSSVSLARTERNQPRTERLGAYLNYDLVFEKVGSQQSVGGTFEAVVFTSKGVGTATALARSGPAGRVTRLETQWTFDDPSRMTSLRIGDSLTRGGVGGTPLRFGGVQWARNFSVQPNFLTLPLPTIGGSAAVPSVVDVLVNNVLADRRDIAAGPFRVDQLPVVTGAGEVQLVVRDALGRESVITRPYYSASQLLRQGLHDYSYELGFLREDFGIRSNGYGAAVASATHRYGFTNALTGEAHVEATGNRQVAGVAADLLHPKLGLFNLSAAGSRADQRIGGLFGLGFERRSAGGLTLGGRVEIATREYARLDPASGERVPAKTAQAFVGMPTAFGSLGASYLLRDARGGEPDAQLLSLNGSARLGPFGYLNATVQRSFSSNRSTLFGVFLTRPLGLRRNMTTSLERGSDGARGTASIQQSLPTDDGWGYRASITQGKAGRLNGWAGYQTGLGLIEAEASRAGGETGIRLGASGSVGLMPGGAFAARKLEGSFAQVRVDGLGGVRVYANNHLVGTTNKNGVLLVPRLQPYEANAISIDAADVPIDLELPDSELRVVPYARSGVVVRFGARAPAGGLVKIVLADGSPLPGGSTVRVAGSEEQFIVAPGGQAYLTGLKASNRIEASWGDRMCAFSLAYQPRVESQPTLGTFTCTAWPGKIEIAASTGAEAARK
jgi:outer membrane usher protein